MKAEKVEKKLLEATEEKILRFLSQEQLKTVQEELRKVKEACISGDFNDISAISTV